MPLLLDNLHQLINQLRNFINYSYDVLVGECFCKGWVFCFFNIVFGLLHCHMVLFNSLLLTNQNPTLQSYDFS